MSIDLPLDPVPETPEHRTCRLRKDVLTRLAESLGFAAGLVEEHTAREFYVVHVSDVGVPHVEKVASVEAAGAYVLKCREDLRVQRLTDPTATQWIFVFEGDRWSLCTFPHWGLVCGDKFMPIEAPKQHVEQDGCLAEPVTPEAFLTVPVQPMGVPQPQVPPNIPKPVIQRPRLFGDDAPTEPRSSDGADDIVIGEDITNESHE